MCKLVCFTSHDPAERDVLIRKAWANMHAEKDGFGAAWVGSNGELAYVKSERGNIVSLGVPSFVEPPFSSGFFESDNADIPSDGGFLIIHGRTATCEKNVENTHPMLWRSAERLEAVLVHNGKVTSKVRENNYCTCDSELILDSYYAGDIKAVEEEIEGYYAFMMIERIAGEKPEDKPTFKLHVVRDNSKATLYCGQRSKAYVMATTEYLLRDVGAELIGKVRDNKVLIFDNPNTPTKFEMSDFTPKKVEDKEVKRTAGKAFGEQPGFYQEHDDVTAEEAAKMDEDLKELEALAAAREIAGD